MKKTFIGVAAACILLIIILATGLWKKILYPNTEGEISARVVVPRDTAFFQGEAGMQPLGRHENLITKIPLENGEIAIAVLNQESEEGVTEEQFVVYRYANDAAKPLYITGIVYDEQSREYKRQWDA
ncbi:MAG: hypothetical protein LBI04_09625, partial [Treponema sp.]|nr:hypothetical protein [Treponema sp.]